LTSGKLFVYMLCLSKPMGPGVECNVSI